MSGAGDEVDSLEPEAAEDECPLVPGLKLEGVRSLKVRRVVMNSTTQKQATIELPYDFGPAFTRAELFRCCGGGLFRVQARLVTGKLSKASVISLEGEPHPFVSPEPVPAPDVTNAREAGDVATGPAAAGPIGATAVQLSAPPPGSPTALVIWDGVDPLTATYLTNDARRTAQTIEAHRGTAEAHRGAAEMVKDVTIKAMESVTRTALANEGALATELTQRRTEVSELRADLNTLRRENEALRIAAAERRGAAPASPPTIGTAFAHFLLRLAHFSAGPAAAQFASFVGMPESEVRAALEEARRTAPALPAGVASAAPPAA